ncbi:MAG TPA: hypothetical protein PLA87_05760 [Pseudomonadota bacterium]|nr:hypothetical protein [Pseudomonadota bacterium]
MDGKTDRNPEWMPLFCVGVGEKWNQEKRKRATSAEKTAALSPVSDEGRVGHKNELVAR